MKTEKTEDETKHNLQSFSSYKINYESGDGCILWNTMIF